MNPHVEANISFLLPVMALCEGCLSDPLTRSVPAHTDRVALSAPVASARKRRPWAPWPTLLFTWERKDGRRHRASGASGVHLGSGLQIIRQASDRRELSSFDQKLLCERD